ncbi:MAG: hypothetical protein H7A25_13860 [Leptospiraceae bacterium]|nr:hypothetical protein [Leptospiraceae bacterium]MCP5500987.1 hypothetical protein [Leptospiraceae bacterium]
MLEYHSLGTIFYIFLFVFIVFFFFSYIRRGEYSDIDWIARKHSIRFCSFGVLLALSLFLGISSNFTWSRLHEGLEFLYRFGVNIGFGLIGLYSSVWYLSPFFGQQIIREKRSPGFLGILLTIISLFLGIFLGSLPGFFVSQFYYRSNFSDGFQQTIIGPLYWIFFFGGIPALSLGFFLGKRIEKGF